MEEKSKKIALGGVLLAIEAIILALINIVPTNTLFLMGIASLISSVIIREFGDKMGVLFTIASVLISFVIIADKIQWILFASSFALYGSVKGLIERKRSMLAEWIMKLVFANIVFAFLYMFTSAVTGININIFVLVPGYNVAFVVYDVVYSQFIDLYNKKLKKCIK